jgi:hypothetical protein
MSEIKKEYEIKAPYSAHVSRYHWQQYKELNTLHGIRSLFPPNHLTRTAWIDILRERVETSSVGDINKQSHSCMPYRPKPFKDVAPD